MFQERRSNPPLFLFCVQVPARKDTGKSCRYSGVAAGSALFISSGMNGAQLDEVPDAEKNVLASFLLVASGSIFIQNVAAL